MIGGMGQRRPPMGPSPMTAGRPNPMAGFQGTGQLGPMGPQGPMGGAQGPPPGWHGGQSTPMMGQIVGGGAMTPPSMGTGQPLYARGSPGGTFTPPAGPIQVDPYETGGSRTFGGWAPGGVGIASVGGPGGGQQAMPLGQVQGLPNFEPYGGGPQGMSDAMMHPFAPRNRGPQGVGPAQLFGANQANVAGQMRRFPGALARGLMQGMAPPPQAPPAPYGGQQFRMW
jgi:hypothetical protein